MTFRAKLKNIKAKPRSKGCQSRTARLNMAHLLAQGNKSLVERLGRL